MYAAEVSSKLSTHLPDSSAKCQRIPRPLFRFSSDVDVDVARYIGIVALCVRHNLELPEFKAGMG